MDFAIATLVAGLTLACGALVFALRRILALRAEARGLGERVEELADRNWELKDAEEHAAASSRHRAT